MPPQEIKRIEEEFDKKFSKLEEYSHADGAYEPASVYVKSFLLHHCAEMYEKGRQDESDANIITKEK